MNRIQYIDRLKGVAILLVVAGHLMCFCTKGDWNPIYEVICSFHMPLFIFLSGIVFSHTPPVKDCHYLYEKAKRFLLPFLWWGLLFTFIIGSSWKEFVFDRYNNGYWYLYILTLFYGVMYLYSKLPLLKHQLVTDVIFFIAFQLIFTVAVKLMSTPLSDATGLGLCKDYWFFFFLGFIVRKYRLTDWLARHNWVFSLALILYIPLLYAYETGIFVHFAQILPLSAIIILISLFRAREHSNSLVEQGLSFIGRGTLDIYVIHYFILRIVNLKDIANYLYQSENYLLEVFMLFIMDLLVAGICILIGRVLRQSEIIRRVVYGEKVTK